MLISVANTFKLVRILRETFEQMKLVETQYKDRNFKYIDQVNFYDQNIIFQKVLIVFFYNNKRIIIDL